jgi:hypothetical protein
MNKEIEYRTVPKEEAAAVIVKKPITQSVLTLAKSLKKPLSLSGSGSSASVTNIASIKSKGTAHQNFSFPH